MAEEDDDLLDASEIEALLRAQEEAEATDAGASPEPAMSDSAGAIADATPTATTEGHLTQGDLDDLFQSQASSVAGSQTDPDLANLLSGQRDGADPFAFPDLSDKTLTGEDLHQLSRLQGVEMNLSIELGRTQMRLDDVVRLKSGSVVPLDKLAGDPVDILVNDRVVAKGEVLVLNDNFCVRVAEILTPDL